MGVWEAPALPARLVGRAKPVFVGRAAETAAAGESWAGARAGAREVIFIGGEPGAGKSRLAEEIAIAAYRQGAVVLMGACSPDSGPPYEPFVECLEQLLGGTAEGALAGCMPSSASELLRLTPLARRHLADADPPAGDDHDYRRTLFDALAELLESVSRERPVVCVLEDLHWAGTATLQLLSHLAQRPGNCRMLLLCTHRTTAPDRSDELTFAIADLYRLEGVRRLDLAGLSADEVVQYLVAEGGLPLRRAREYGTVLRDQTGGNPFFLREAWRDMVTRGAAAPARGLGSATPVSIRETLQRRLARLGPREREVLEVAAVLGDGGDVRLLAAAFPGQPSEALPALDTAARFGLLDAGELSRGRVAFPHTLTRQAVLDLVDPSRRALLHAQAGELLETAGAGSPRAARQLAYHFSRASALGYSRKAAEYLVLSAQEAERSLAFEDAAACYAQAADLLEGTEAGREELRFAAARCCVRAGDFAGARRLYLLLNESGNAYVRLRAAVGYEDAAWRPGLPGADACTLLTRALHGVPADPHDLDYVGALASLGRAMAFTGDAERARSLGERALGHARRLGDKRLLTHALQTMMWHAAAPNSLDRQQALADELANLARESEDWEALGTASVFRSAIAYSKSDPATWADAVADQDRAVRASGQPFMAYMRGSVDYAHAFLRGDFSRAEQVAEDLLEVGRSFGPDDTEGPYGLQMYMIRRETGALEALRPLVDAMAAAGNTWQPGLLALCTELGLTSRAQSLLRELLDGIGPAPAPQSPWAQWTAVMVFAAEAAVALRDCGAARRLRPLVARYSGLQLVAGQFVAVFGPADAYLAALDSVLGDDRSAQRHFGLALAQSRALGSVVHQAAIMAAWSEHMRSRGDLSSRFAGMRDTALRLATGIGQQRVVRLLGRGADQPAGLTARELDVVRLLARGSSNRDIAARLRISESTAANHVRSILLKTGAANRTQAAAMALSRGWAGDRSPHEPG
jgi:DNA-binding CsgD family transcriptional regulator